MQVVAVNMIDNVSSTSLSLLEGNHFVFSSMKLNIYTCMGVLAMLSWGYYGFNLSSTYSYTVQITIKPEGWSFVVTGKSDFPMRFILRFLSTFPAIQYFVGLLTFAIYRVLSQVDTKDIFSVKRRLCDNVTLLCIITEVSTRFLLFLKLVPGK